jgi:uncharacterized protein (TIGR02118 family)
LRRGVKQDGHELTDGVCHHDLEVIKLVYCFRKKSSMTDVEFREYWRNVHGPIGVRIPGLRRLVQSPCIKVAGDKHEPDFDGMAELWFDSREALLAARSSAEWKAVTEDEVNFINHRHTAYFVSEEDVILDLGC